MHDVGMASRESLDWLYSDEQTNTLADNTVLFGTDMRLQSTRSFIDSAASRVYIPMQVALYGAYQPAKWLIVEGSLNLASFVRRSGAQVRFPGQQPGTLSAMIKPDAQWPSIRLGLFRPAVGMRYDDHTVFPISYATPRARTNYLPPDWAEWGAEVTWESLKWLTIQGGVFDRSALGQVTLSDGLDYSRALTGYGPTLTGKVVLWNRFADNELATYVGGSILETGAATMVSGFLGIGYKDAMYCMAEVTQTDLPEVINSTMGLVELGWQVVSPMILYARYEHGQATQAALQGPSVLTSVILGAQLFPIPFVEIRPEYRMFDTFYDGVNTRWNVQLHVFY